MAGTGFFVTAGRQVLPVVLMLCAQASAFETLSDETLAGEQVAAAVEVALLAPRDDLGLPDAPPTSRRKPAGSVEAVAAGEVGAPSPPVLEIDRNTVRDVELTRTHTTINSFTIMSRP